MVVAKDENSNVLAGLPYKVMGDEPEIQLARQICLTIVRPNIERSTEVEPKAKEIVRVKVHVTQGSLLENQSKKR